MLITLKLFASLREQLGISLEDIELPDHVTTIGAARTFLSSRGEAWQALLGPRVRSALDRRVAHDSALLHEGAELAFFPPVTGGLHERARPGRALRRRT